MSVQYSLFVIRGRSRSDAIDVDEASLEPGSQPTLGFVVLVSLVAGRGDGGGGEVHGAADRHGCGLGHGSDHRRKLSCNTKLAALALAGWGGRQRIFVDKMVRG